MCQGIETEATEVTHNSSGGVREMTVEDCLADSTGETQRQTQRQR